MARQLGLFYEGKAYKLIRGKDCAGCVFLYNGCLIPDLAECTIGEIYCEASKKVSKIWSTYSRVKAYVPNMQYYNLTKAIALSEVKMTNEGLAKVVYSDVKELRKSINALKLSKEELKSLKLDLNLEKITLKSIKELLGSKEIK